MQSLLAAVPASGAAAAAAVSGLVAAAALAERADHKNRLNLPPGDLTCIGDPYSSLAMSIMPVLILIGFSSLYCISLIRSVHSDRHRHHTAVSCLFFLG
jgi:hypothetical protein